VREGRLSAGEATYIGKELCSALAAVHQADLLHRDVKAQNVMRASDGGRIILMDFGAGEFRSVPTAGGKRLGTPLYLAPEIMTGGAATIQTDIYALGVLLYYLVTGQFPVTGSSLPDLVLAHARGARRRLRDARPDLPDPFVSVVQRAIDPDPRRRFQSAGEFHAALEAREDPHSTPTGLNPAVIYTPAPNAQAPLAYTLIGATVVAGLIGVCGLVSARTFDVALGVTLPFVAGPSEYLTEGTRCVLPLAINWLGGIAIVTVLSGVYAAFKRRLDPFVAPWRRWTESIRPASLATLIAVAGAFLWLALTWWAWPIFDALWTFPNRTIATSADGPVLDPALYTRAMIYSQLCAMLTFVLLLAVWRWWPSIERRADDLDAVRRMRWVSVAVMLAIIIGAVASRRVYFEKFDLVLYKKQPALVIGSSGDELLLLTVHGPSGSGHVRARRYSPDVEGTGKRQSLVGRE
jgi:hypothetical protein